MNEKIDLYMCAVAYAVARVLYVLSFIKIEVYKLDSLQLVLLIDQILISLLIIYYFYSKIFVFCTGFPLKCYECKKNITVIYVSFCVLSHADVVLQLPTMNIDIFHCIKKI